MADCIFCKIVKGTIPSEKVWESEDVLAFKDIEPQAPVHILLIPKKHIASLNDLKPEDKDTVANIVLAAQQIAAEQGVAENGYRIVNNCGADGGQIVHHIHFHLLGGAELGVLNAAK